MQYSDLFKYKDTENTDMIFIFSINKTPYSLCQNLKLYLDTSLLQILCFSRKANIAIIILQITCANSRYKISVAICIIYTSHINPELAIMQPVKRERSLASRI